MAEQQTLLIVRQVAEPLRGPRLHVHAQRPAGISRCEPGRVVDLDDAQGGLAELEGGTAGASTAPSGSVGGGGGGFAARLDKLRARHAHHTSGMIAFDWKHGGESRITYAWPEDFD